MKSRYSNLVPFMIKRIKSKSNQVVLNVSIFCNLHVVSNVPNLVNTSSGSECMAISHTEAGSDYVAVIEEQLVFSPGDSRMCHMIGILQDEDCELRDKNESFFSDLSIVGDILDITVDPATAEIVINDLEEPECGKRNLTCCESHIHSWYLPCLHYRSD